MKQGMMPFVCGLQTGILLTIMVSLFFLPGPEMTGSCACSHATQGQIDQAKQLLNSLEICGLPKIEQPEVSQRISLGEYYLTAAVRRCRPCGTKCRCGAICRCPK